MWQVVGGLFAGFTAWIVLLLMIGVNLGSEYRRVPWLSISRLLGQEPRGTRLSACGVARVLLPESAEQAIPCLWWNLGSFYLIPMIALGFAVKASISRD
jgi:hypothetical protein